MRTVIYNLLREPRGDTYSRLVSYSLNHCDSFLLVVRDTIDLNETAKSAIRRFEPFVLGQTEESEWPGTKLVGGTASVYRVKLCGETASLLSQIADGLYSWVQPGLPEDLSLLRLDGRPWLVTISHEKDGYFELTSQEKADLTKAVPDLVLGGDAFKE